MADRDRTAAGASAVDRRISKLTKRKQSEKGHRDFICLHLSAGLVWSRWRSRTHRLRRPAVSQTRMVVFFMSRISHQDRFNWRKSATIFQAKLPNILFNSCWESWLNVCCRTSYMSARFMCLFWWFRSLRSITANATNASLICWIKVLNSSYGVIQVSLGESSHCSVDHCGMRGKMIFVLSQSSAMSGELRGRQVLELKWLNFYQNSSPAGTGHQCDQ